MTNPQKIEGGWEQEIKLLWIKGDKLERELGRKAMWEAVLNEAIAISEKEIAKAKSSERQRIVNGLFKPNHRYIVWIEKNELKVLDEASIKIK